MVPARERRTEKRRRHGRHVPGLSPGTIQVDPDAPRPALHAMSYGPHELTEGPIENAAEVNRLLQRPGVAWLNVDGLGDAEIIQQLGEAFDLHRLALEDVVNTHQRAKVETYGETTFVVLRTIRLGQRLASEQLSLFLGRNFVLTFQESAGDCLDPVRRRIREGRPRLRNNGADYLAYALLDAVVDSYFPILEAFGERIETLEEQVLERPDPATMAAIFQVRGDLLNLRRAIWPLREALHTLLREPLPQVTDDTRIYLRDCYDHAVQIIDILESLRETASSLMDVYLSSVSNRMNEIMKVLTIFAALFIPLTFVAGIYGMNFNPEISPLNMPELNWFWGYPFALGLMAALAGVLLVYFRRKGWL